MQLKKLISSLVLALSLTGGQTFAANMEPAPEKEEEELPNKEAETEPVTVELAFAEVKPVDEEEPVEDFLPEVPILYNGKLYSADELKKAGIELSHYVLDASSAEQDVMQGFSDAESLKVYLEKTGQLPSNEPQDERSALSCWWSRLPSYFYDGTSYTGSYFTVRPGFGHAFLGGWDNRISSLRSSRCGRWTVLTEYPGYQGRRLWLGRGWAVPNLSSYYVLPFHIWPWRFYTWNNRASSVMVLW